MEKIGETMLKKIFKKLPLVGGYTLYYPGCLTRFAAPKLQANYEKILKKIGIDYITIPEFNCCGAPAFHAGYDTDFYELSQKNKDIFKEHDVRRIITSCPSCMVIFKDLYGIKTLHITQVIAKHLQLFEQKRKDEPVCYHDPCHLSRKGGITQEPRKILSHLGFEVIEMSQSKEDTFCCGGGGGLKANDPGLSDRVAALRLSQCRTSKLITTCPLCYKNLKQSASKQTESKQSASRQGAKGITVLELSEVLIDE